MKHTSGFWRRLVRDPTPLNMNQWLFDWQSYPQCIQEPLNRTRITKKSILVQIIIFLPWKFGDFPSKKLPKLGGPGWSQAKLTRSRAVGICIHLRRVYQDEIPVMSSPFSLPNKQLQNYLKTCFTTKLVDLFCGFTPWNSLTWKAQKETEGFLLKKMILLFNLMIFSFHVNIPACWYRYTPQD